MPSRGSAAADELLPRVRRALPAMALAVDGSDLTAIANDCAACRVLCELIESELFPETAAT